MKLIIAGSRIPPNTKIEPWQQEKLSLLAQILIDLDFDGRHDPLRAPLAAMPKVTQIVSGGATGIDTVGEMFANRQHLHVERFPAQWYPLIDGKRHYDPLAGYKRNRIMAQYADAALVMWDGKSRGSKHMARTMVQFGKPVVLYNFTTMEYIDPSKLDQKKIK